MLVTCNGRSRFGLTVAFSVKVAATLAVLVSPGFADNKKPPPPHVVQPVRLSAPIIPNTRFRPPSSNVPVQRRSVLPTTLSNVRINNGVLAPTGYPSHGLIGSVVPGQSGAPIDRRFGEPASATGTRRFGKPDTRLVRVQNGRNYFYHGRAFARFEAPRYRWPHGYRYRPYAIGYVLPRRFWVHDYYIDNYAVYDLDAPPPDFEWVRYGPDILLVDLTSGAISQVIYGAFDEADASSDASADASPDQ